MSAANFPHRLYRWVGTLAVPIVGWWLRRRLADGREDAGRLGERFGFGRLPRPPGRLIWIHAASVGESLSVLPLIKLLPADHTVLMTTGTVTSARLIAARQVQGLLHHYIPVDLPVPVTRFFDHWRPDLAIWIESELWPNLLAELRHRRIPAALINARLSARSHRRWRWFPGMAASMLDSFRLICAQSPDDAERLTDLGARNVQLLGNLKFAAATPDVDATELARFHTAQGNRPCWLFASTHPGEETLACDWHQRLQQQFPDLLTIIAPRHPDRGETVANLVAERGLSTIRRSTGQVPSVADSILIADSLGEMGLWYRLAAVTVMGGSFIPVGGHNPIEPLLAGSATVFGPYADNFAQIVAQLQTAGGLQQITDMTNVAERLAHLLADPPTRQTMVNTATAIIAGHADVARRIVEALAPLLEPTTP